MSWLYNSPICPICEMPVHDNQDSIVDYDEICHSDCFNDNPGFFEEKKFCMKHGITYMGTCPYCDGEYKSALYNSVVMEGMNE